MRRLCKLMALLAMASALAVGQDKLPVDAPCDQRPRAALPLVPTGWLAQHLGQNVVVLSVASPRFEQGHIPYAQPLGGVADIGRALRAAGARRDSLVVLYQDSGIPVVVATIFVALEEIGWGGRVSVLNGGLRAWRAEGRPIETGAPRPVTPNDSAGTNCRATDVQVNRRFVQKSLGRPGILLLDARTEGLYSGAAVEDGEPAGHIPGAVNLPFTRMANPDGYLRPNLALAQEFRAVGVQRQQLLVVYCHSGRKASLVYLAGRALGLNIRIYQGSWRDWTRDHHLAGSRIPRSR